MEDQFIEYLSSFSGFFSYLVILTWLLVCGVGVPIPEDISLFAAGLLSYHGNAEVHIMILVALFGVLGGDTFIYFMGRRYGRNLLEHPFLRRLISPENEKKAEALFQRRGNAILFGARFAPGFRAPIFFSAGVLQVKYRIFIMFDGLAALISVPTIVYTSYYFGDQISAVINLARKTNMGIFIAILILAAFFLGKRFLSKR